MKASSAAIDCCRFLFLSSTSFFWGSSYFFFTHRRILGRRLKSDAINQRATSLRFRSTKCLSAVNDQLFSSVHLVVSLFLFFSLLFLHTLFSSSLIFFLQSRLSATSSFDSFFFFFFSPIDQSCIGSTGS